MVNSREVGLPYMWIGPRHLDDYPCRLNRSMQHYPIWKFLINRWFCKLRTNLASPLQRKRLIFGPFKGLGCQFNTLEKCSVLKFLQAGFARVLRRPIETAPLIGTYPQDSVS